MWTWGQAMAGAISCVSTVLMITVAHAQLLPAVPENLPEIHRLSLAGDVRAIKRAIAQDSNVVRTLDKRGCTALSWARDRTTAKALAKAGVDLNRQDADGLTALMHAAFFGRDDVIDELLKMGSDPRLLDRLGNTALHWSGTPAVARRLMRAGLRPDVRNKRGDVPATTALLFGRSEASKLLTDELRRIKDQRDWRLLDPKGMRVLVWPLLHRAMDSDDEGVISGQIAEGSKRIREALAAGGFEVVDAPRGSIPELTMSPHSRQTYERPSHPLFGAGWEGEITLLEFGEDEVMPVAKAANADLVVVPVVLAALWIQDSIRAVCVSQVSVLNTKSGTWICNPVHGLYEDRRWMVYPLAKKKNAAAQSLYKALEPFLYLCGATKKGK